MEEIKPVNNIQQSTTQPILRKIPKESKKKNMVMILSAIAVVFLGIGTGWLLTQQTSGSSSSAIQTAPGVGESSTQAGSIVDEEICKDVAEGDLETGGFEGEGTHHLVRGDSESKWTYLTSTVIDLESFSGKKVEVTGETIAAQNVGWLMDVCMIKVID